jgi:hypothetical protein
MRGTHSAHLILRDLITVIKCVEKFHTHTTGQIIILYILMFIVLYTRGEDKILWTQY